MFDQFIYFSSWCTRVSKVEFDTRAAGDGIKMRPRSSLFDPHIKTWRPPKPPHELTTWTRDQGDQGCIGRRDAPYTVANFIWTPLYQYNDTREVESSCFVYQQFSSVLTFPYSRFKWDLQYIVGNSPASEIPPNANDLKNNPKPFPCGKDKFQPVRLHVKLAAAWSLYGIQMCRSGSTIHCTQVSYIHTSK